MENKMFKDLEEAIEITSQVLELEKIEVDDPIDKWFDPEFDDGPSSYLVFANDDNDFCLTARLEDEDKMSLENGTDIWVIGMENDQLRIDSTITKFVGGEMVTIDNTDYFDSIQKYTDYLTKIKQVQ